jgi:YVTN family beta-propeller protein
MSLRTSATHRGLFAFLAAILLFHSSISLTARSQDRKSIRALAPDQAEDEDDLNRELWEFAKKTPFEELQRYVATAQQAAKAVQANEAVLPNGWRIAPAGTQTEVGRLPYEVVPFAGKLVVLDTGYYIREPQEVSIVDPATTRVVKTLKINSVFPSAAEGGDGNLYISGGFDQKVYTVTRNFELGRQYPVDGYVAGLAALDRTHLAVVYLASKNAQGDYSRGKISLLNIQSGKIEKEITTDYFPYAIRKVNDKLYVTLLGKDRLLVYDSNLKLLKTINVGRAPQEICSGNGRLYVANTNSDTLSVVDTSHDTVVSTIKVQQQSSPFGAAPTSCAVDGNRLYVTLAGMNAVEVFDARSQNEIGLIPTGWYPTKALSNGGKLLVLSAKGIRARRPNSNGPQPVQGKGGPAYVLTLLKGSLGAVDVTQINSNLKKWTQQVKEGGPVFSAARGFKMPIRHIFYIIKENRTYDQVLGDLGRGNGDPALTIFGRDITPNHHRLAEQFVTLDNFFADGEISVLGHSFTTSGYASPFLEWLGNAAYSQRYKGYPFGSAPASLSPAYIWDALDEAHVDYRIYGENYFLFDRAYNLITRTYGADSELARRYYARTVEFAAKVDRGNEFFQLAQPYYGQANSVENALKLLDKPEFINGFSRFLVGDESFAQALRQNSALRGEFARYLYHYAFNYRSWDLKYSDLDRFKAWRDDFDQQVKSGRLPQFEYIWLPNDHTNGSDTSILSPYQFVAQNDTALGRIIETISHSPAWKDSLILVEEDDAQNGPDHVDATRTVAFAVGPYVKRGAVISDRYDQISMLRTVEVLLGLKPLNLGDRMAAPMFGIFTDKPDFTPYMPAPPSSALSEADKAKNGSE